MAKASNAKPATQVNIGPVKIGFAFIWKPQQTKSGKMKYSVKLYIPKKNKALVGEIMQAINAAVKQGVAANKWGGKDPKKIRDFKWALRDGDKEDTDDEMVKGHYFINASSDNKPGIIGRNGRDIIDQDEVYSGAICYSSVNFYPFNEGGGNGIAAGLNNILKWEDGERLSGRRSAQSDFADIVSDADADEDLEGLPFGNTGDTDDDEEIDFLS